MFINPLVLTFLLRLSISTVFAAYFPIMAAGHFVLVAMDLLLSMFSLPFLVGRKNQGVWLIGARFAPWWVLLVLRDFPLELLQDGGLLLVGLFACEKVIQRTFGTDKFLGIVSAAFAIWALPTLFYVLAHLIRYETFQGLSSAENLIGPMFLAIGAIPIFVGFHAGLRVESPTWKLPIATGLKRTLLVTLSVAAPFLHYGLVCLVIYSPIVLVTTVLGVLLGRFVRRASGWELGRLLLTLFVVACATEPLWFHPAPVEVEFTNTQVVALSKPSVWNSLDALELEVASDATPFWAKAMGLPVPLRVDGPGTHPGAIRKVTFDRGEVWATVTERVEGQRFALALKPMNEGPEFFSHWVKLTSSEFILRAVDDSHTEVIHRTRYIPRLYPRALFQPIETWAGGALQQALLDGYMKSVQPSFLPKVAPCVAAQ